MTRQSLRNRHPFHDRRLATTLVDAPKRAPYDRYSLRHRSLVILARLRRILGV